MLPLGAGSLQCKRLGLAARSIATQTRCFGKLQATAGNLAVVLFLGYGSTRQARLSDEATRHAPPSAARPDSSRPRTAGAISPRNAPAWQRAGGRFRLTGAWCGVYSSHETSVNRSRRIVGKPTYLPQGLADAARCVDRSKSTEQPPTRGCFVSFVYERISFAATKGRHLLTSVALAILPSLVVRRDSAPS